MALIQTEILKWVMLSNVTLFSKWNQCENSFNNIRWWPRTRGSHVPSHMHHYGVTIYLYFHKTYKHQIWYSGNLDWGALTYQSHVLMNIWSLDVMQHLHSKNIYTNQTWHGYDLGWRVPFYKVTFPFVHVVRWCHVVMWQNKNTPLWQHLHFDKI